MAPFSGDLVGSRNKLLANDNAAANTRAKDNSEHNMGTYGSAIECSERAKQFASFSNLIGRPSL
jgi:hypothetical protein